MPRSLLRIVPVLAAGLALAGLAWNGAGAAPGEAPGELTAPATSLGLAEDLQGMVNDNLGSDPAEWTSLRTSLDRVAGRLDSRTDAQLVTAMSEAESPVLREQAIYEYADRLAADAVPALAAALAKEGDPRVRIDTLIAIAKQGGAEAGPILRRVFEGETVEVPTNPERPPRTAVLVEPDADAEVREWARILYEEAGLGDVGFEPRKVRSYPGRTFDQSIPLHIACNLYVKGPRGSWVKAVMSPLKIEQVFGNCHANPSVATREHQLVLTKRLRGFNADGSDHWEVFRFRGLTERTDPHKANFAFVAHEERPFFLSGQINDTSEGVLAGDVSFLRVGQWRLDPNIPVQGDAAIRYVKGNFMSWGYVDLRQTADDDDGDGDPLDAGEMLRAVVYDGDKVYSNTLVAGTWKGKISDEDGDGVLDLNYPRQLVTRDGWLDLDADGVADEPRRTTTAFRSAETHEAAIEARTEGRYSEVDLAEGLRYAEAAGREPRR